MADVKEKSYKIQKQNTIGVTRLGRIMSQQKTLNVFLPWKTVNKNVFPTGLFLTQKPVGVVGAILMSRLFS